MDSGSYSRDLSRGCFAVTELLVVGGALSSLLSEYIRDSGTRPDAVNDDVLGTSSFPRVALS